jgi:hypothetical protein
MPLHPADERLTLVQVDEAVIGELRHEHFRHVLEGGDDFQRAGQPLADALEQGDPVLLPLAVALARLAGQDHDSVDIAARVAQGHGESPDERTRPVAADAFERSFPRTSVQHLSGEILRFPHVIFGEHAEGQDRAAGQPRHITGNTEKPYRVLVDVQEITEPVRDHDSYIRLAQDHVRRKVRVESSFTPARHACAPRPR